MLASIQLLSLLLCQPVTAQEQLASDGRSAEQIWRESRKRYRLENAVQTMHMVLVSRSGSERVREIETRIRRSDDITRSYTRFLSPADVAGTQLVMVDHPGQQDEQLMYLPALERVTRIAGSARSRSFMGSDFRYDDFELDDGAAGEHLLQEETAEHWVVESKPADSDWTRVVTRISRQDELPRHAQYYDKRGELARELLVEEVQVHDGVPVPARSVMKDLKRGTQTRIELRDVRVNVPDEELPDEMFTAAYLEQNG